jgi:hypothetical protein
MKTPIAFSALLPAFLVGVLATSAGAQCLNWSTRFGPPNGGLGMNARIYDFAVHNGVTPPLPPYHGLFAGGDFTNAGGTPANRIACWDGVQWKALGTGCDNSVFALHANLDATNPLYGLWVGGAFTTAGGTTVNHVAKWTGGFGTLNDGSAIGTDGNVFALTTYNNDLILAGTFANAGITPANNIARWDGTAFYPFTTFASNGTSGGFNGRVDALEEYAGDLYVGGWFTAAGPYSAGLIGKWNGTAWQPFGIGLTGSNVYDLCTFNGELYVGGNFSMANGNVAVNNVAKWNGTNWSAVGTGFNNVVRDLYVFDDGSGKKLYATGHFTFDGTNTTPLDYIAVLVGGNWQPVSGPDLGGGAISLAMHEYDDLTGGGSDLFVGSICTTAGGNPSNYVAEFHGCAVAPFPVVDGEVVVTREPSGPKDYAVALLDLSGTPAPPNTHWKVPKFHNELQSNPLDVWNLSNLGHVFGVCFDRRVGFPPDIYVSATSSYGGATFASGGPGAVYRLNGGSAAITTFATLPNTGSALGDVCAWNFANLEQLYVSNFEDGKIYRYNAFGALQQVWDPFPSTTNTPGFVQLGERVWGLRVYNPRELYFSVWLRDRGRQATPWPTVWGSQGSNNVNNALFKVRLNATTGAIIGTPVLVKILPYLPGTTYSNPVADISFSPDNRRLLLAEKPMNSDTTPSYWEARVLEYVGGGPGIQYLNWTLSGSQYQIGCLPSGPEIHDAEGGADYDCSDRVLGTGDPLGIQQGSLMTGVQRIPAVGNSLAINTTTSELIDIDGETVGFDKLGLGDLEVYRPSCSTKWFAHCVAKTNSLGCVPSIDAAGDPSLAAGSFTVFCEQVRNAKSGLLFYSVTDAGNTPFQGGTLCVAPPVKRTPATSSGGTPPPATDCTGVLSIDMTAFAMGALGGSPLPDLSQPGTVVDCQFWSRDPGASFNTSLSDGLEYAVEP